VALEYRNVGTFWHKLDPRSKILWVTALIVQLFVWTDPAWIMITLAILLISGMTAKLPWREVWNFIKWLIPLVVIAATIGAFTYSPVFFKVPGASMVICQLGPLRATLGGLFYGISFAQKMIFAILVISFLTYTTSFMDILQVMQKWGMPYQLVFVMSTAWRLAPIFKDIYMEIMVAQAARGLEVEKGGIIERMRKMVIALIPLYSKALDYTERLSLAMEARAFGSQKNVTLLREFKYERADYVVVALSFALIAVSIALAMLGYGVL
jgi:energy-coupling factor transport system permease protein